MVKQNSSTNAAKTATKPPKPDASIVIAALRNSYPGRFCEDEIPSDKTRKPLNTVCRALDGITSIAKILYANEVERDAGGEGAQVLSTTLVYGLFEGLVLLAEHGNFNATDLGEALFQEAKKGGAR